MSREMKHSGIEWIGLIPKEWKVVPHKHIMFKKKDIQEHYQGQDIISLTMNGVIVRDLDAGGKMPLSFDGYQIICPNNLLLCLFDIDVTPRCVGLIKNYGVTSPAYSQFVLKDKAYPPYYDYLLRYMDDHKCLLHLSKNLRSSLTETDFGQIQTCVPPFQEQQKIADYLDKVCSEVDELVALQEKMIEELKAYKQSVITEAVTKGLNPNVPMKDSGIDWIGEIPKEWKVVKLRNLGNFTASGIDKNIIEGEELVHIVNYVDVYKNNTKELRKHNYMVVSAPQNKCVEHQLYVGDMIYTPSSETVEDIGLSSVVMEELPNTAYSYHVLRFRSNDSISLSYKKYITNNHFCLSYFSSCATGTIRKTISRDVFRECKVLLPPLHEQQKIADYLDRVCSEVDELVALKQDKIEELKEYKKSVIYEYVTGKKEVV